MIGGFIAVENHEVFGKNFTIELGNIKYRLVIFGKCSKLFSKKVFGKSIKIMAFSSLQFNLIKIMNRFRVGSFFNGDLILLSFTKSAAQTLTHVFKNFFFGIF